MVPRKRRPFDGIYAANVCPFRPDYRIDEDALAEHVRWIADTPGMTGVLCNGHGGEVPTLAREERRRVIEVVREAIGDRAVIVSGVACEGTLEAMEHARDAHEAGADALLVFPPYAWVLSQDARVALTHHRGILKAGRLPVMLFQYSVHAGQAPYSPSVLTALARLPGVVGVKEGSWETAAYERTLRLLRRVAPQMAVMASGDEHLLTTFILGTDGSLVSLASLMPRHIATLYEAVKAGDLKQARAVHHEIYPLATAIYGTPPGGHAIPRLKACLKMIGKLRRETVRPPLTAPDRTERAMLKRALKEARLL